MWNLEPADYFEAGRYLSFTPPKAPHPLPPAAVEPYGECVARQKRGEVSAVYDGWWAPSRPAPCVKHIPQYADKNGDQGVTISEARMIAPRLQAYLATQDSRTVLRTTLRTAIHAACNARCMQCTLHAMHAACLHAAGTPEDGRPLPGGTARRHGGCVAAQSHLCLPHV